MSEPVNVLKEALLTEKATMLSANLNQYVFSVFPEANRTNIKNAIESTFGVNVIKINTLTQKPKSKRDRMRRGKLGHTALSKKAIVTLKAGDSIDLA
ncbi:MAG: 50S ribosomal protein L23 [Opitutae bacterium]